MAIKKKKEIVDKKNPQLPDKIVQVNAIDQYMADMARYSIYVLFDRFVPNFQDGLKPVQRRTLYCMWNDIKCHSISTKRKSANTTGMTIALYHAHCLSSNTKIFLLDNTIITIGELYNKGITTFESIGVDPSTMKTIPIVVRNLRIGQYTDKIYHIQFSNGTEICCTWNHPFLLTNGTYKQAKDLTLNDTPYIVNHYISSSKPNRPQIHDKTGSKMLHHIISDYYYGVPKPNYHRHHIDFNTFNNNKNNITIIHSSEHSSIHENHNHYIEIARSHLRDKNSLGYIRNKIKNHKLMQIFMEDQNIRKFKHAIKILENQNIPITIENYEKNIKL